MIMIDVESNLVLSRDSCVEDSTLIENCADHYEQLIGFSVYLPNNRVPYVEDYLNNIPNGGYIKKLLAYNKQSAMRMILSISKKTSYTEVFLEIYGGVQGILDAFAVAEDSIKENSDDSDFFEDSIPKDTAPITSIKEECEAVTKTMRYSVADVEPAEENKDANTNEMDVKTDPVKTASNEIPVYDNVTEESSKQNVPAIVSGNDVSVRTGSGADFQSFLQQLICKTIQAEQAKESEECLSIKELRMAQRKIASTDADNIKTAVIDMLDNVSTYEDMITMTKFLGMFIDELGGSHE